jgi:hypothetical protein
MRQVTFTATTMTTGSGERYNLDKTVFYCLQQTELQDMAEYLFDKAYQKLEKTLFGTVAEIALMPTSLNCKSAIFNV